jgi:hypothetical protein
VPRRVGQFGPVGLGELPILSEHLGRIGGDAFEHLGDFSLVLAREDLLALERPFELRHVERVHAFEPIETEPT